MLKVEFNNFSDIFCLLFCLAPLQNIFKWGNERWILNLSALTGERVKKLFSKIDILYEQFRRKTGTGALNRVIEDMMRKNPPPRTGRGSVKLFYGTQTRTGPPTFVVFTNKPDKIHFSYKRFMVNQLREQLGLDLTPIRLVFKKK